MESEATRTERLAAILQNNPVIASIKDDAGLERMLASRSRLGFLLYGTINSLPEQLRAVAAARKLAFRRHRPDRRPERGRRWCRVPQVAVRRPRAAQQQVGGGQGGYPDRHGRHPPAFHDRLDGLPQPVAADPAGRPGCRRDPARLHPQGDRMAAGRGARAVDRRRPDPRRGRCRNRSACRRAAIATSNSELWTTSPTDPFDAVGCTTAKREPELGGSRLDAAATEGLASAPSKTE